MLDWPDFVFVVFDLAMFGGYVKMIVMGKFVLSKQIFKRM